MVIMCEKPLVCLHFTHFPAIGGWAVWSNANTCVLARCVRVAQTIAVINIESGQRIDLIFACVCVCVWNA